VSLKSQKRVKRAPLWVYPNVDPAWTETIIEEFHIHPAAAQVLAARGFRDLDAIHDHLYARLPDLYDPSLFPEMPLATQRILQARKKKERILIYGDNDVDGMTATALLVEFFSVLGLPTISYIPNRTSLGRSVMRDAIEYATAKGCSLLITVDCGITSVGEIAEAVARGIDVIITDHHEPTSALPHCVATLNPKLVGSPYPNRELTGVGVAFKLAHGVTDAMVEEGLLAPGIVDLKRYLDLVALGTIADMGALIGENRILVRYGLKQMRKARRIGITKLCALCEVKVSEINPGDIASKVAPRLNSLGRIADPNHGVDLLLLRDGDAAEKLAQELDLHNFERQRIERLYADEIERYLAAHPEVTEGKAIVLSSPKWHPGIIPILTTRVAKQYSRPTVIIAIEEGLGKGSIRTIPEFPLLPVLKANSSLLIDFGGHDYAAGMTISQDNIALFKEKFVAAAEAMLTDQAIEPKLQIDGVLSFEDLTFEFMESLNLLEPFGNGNLPPVFTTSARQAWSPKLVGRTHLKLYLDQNGRMLEGIAFGMADRRPEILQKNLALQIAFTPQVNVFLNKASIQLQVKDFYPL
jgi:single-stranded-DNA-specific exonuclease